MTWERTRDYELVRAIATHPRLYQAAADDFAPDPEAWRPSESEAIVYVLARDEHGIPVALFPFQPLNAVCYVAHVFVLPAAWGTATALFRGAISFAFRSTSAERIIGMIPADNRLALRLARVCGFEEFGVNPRAILRGGTLQDVILTGVSKHGFHC